MSRTWPELPALKDPDHFPFVIAHRYALGDAPDRLRDLRAVTASWRPDAVVFESCDLAAPIVAAELGVPIVHHSFGRALASACYQRSAPFLEPLWQRVGTGMHVLCGMYDGAYVDICPPSLQGALPAAVRPLPLRPGSAAQPGPARPAFLDLLPVRPTVYVTLGTVFNDVTRLRLLLDAFADLDCNVVMTTGRDHEASELGVAPGNAVVEQFVPQATLLPHVSAAVTHAGSGSMLAALAPTACRC